MHLQVNLGISFGLLITLQGRILDHCRNIRYEIFLGYHSTRPYPYLSSNHTRYKILLGYHTTRPYSYLIAEPFSLSNRTRLSLNEAEI